MLILLYYIYVKQDVELTILDVQKFKPIHKRKFNYEASILLFVGLKLKWSEVEQIIIRFVEIIINLVFGR